jgi:hypothetical protein
MDDKQRLQLQDMIKINNVEDQTELIRELKHSQILRNDVNKMILLKAKYRGDDDKIYNECVNECNFLFKFYTDIFNKVRKNEIDINILNQFFDTLRKVEDGELNQHEGSFMIGTLLKELYIDSALKKSTKLDKLSKLPDETKKDEYKPSENYLEYKKKYGKK